MDKVCSSPSIVWFFSPARNILWALILAIGLLLLLFNSFSAQAAPECNRYVLLGGSDATTCGDINFPCGTIQHAIESADPDDLICVASHASLGPLVYKERLKIEKNIYLDGKWEASCSGLPQRCTFTAVKCTVPEVTIDAERNGRVVTIFGKYKPTIDCFTITGGDANGLGGDPGSLASLPFNPGVGEMPQQAAAENNAGGGIYVYQAAPTIINNLILDNYACNVCDAYGHGGGIFLLESPHETLIAYNEIRNNVADNSSWGQGGGIMLRDSDAQIIDNLIIGNRAGFSAGEGGGMAVQGGSPTLIENEITDNIGGQSLAGAGGGIYIFSGKPVRIENNTFDSNRAISGAGSAALSSAGGGLYYHGMGTADPVIQGNRFYMNNASPLGPLAGYGGGAYLSSLAAPALVIGNTFSENIAGYNESGYGGGLYVNNSTLRIRENTFTQNAATWSGKRGEGGGLFVKAGNALIEHNLFTSNYAAGFLGSPSIAEGFGGGAALVESNSLFQYNNLHDNYATRGENQGTGGGVFANQGLAQILGNIIEENIATLYGWGLGGGIAISDCLALVRDNSLIGNMGAGYNPIIPTGGEGGAGGGLYSLKSKGLIERNLFLKNVAAQVEDGHGGGGYAEESELWIDGNTILGNSSSPGGNGTGGGIRLLLNSIFTFTNNIVASNSSPLDSGISIQMNGGWLVNNTIAENLGGDGVGVFILSGDPVHIMNNIIVTQTIGIVNGLDGTSHLATFNLFENNGLDFSAGIDSSLAYGGPAALDERYHLTPGSNALEHALPFAWLLHDIDFDPRFSSLFPDLGADEFTWHIWMPQLITRLIIY